MRIVNELKGLIEKKRDELTKLEAALEVLTGQTPFELKHPIRNRKEKRKPRSKSPRRYRRKRVVMATGHYEAIIGSMLHAQAGLEVTVKDIVKHARRQGAHATKSAVHAVVVKMVIDGWLERRGTRVREVLYRRAMMAPARWQTLYKEGEVSR
jgi:hypothetical protein